MTPPEDVVAAMNAFNAANDRGETWWSVALHFADVDATEVEYKLDEAAFVARTSAGLRMIETRRGYWKDEGPWGK